MTHSKLGLKHYWICSKCAAEKGGLATGRIVTVMKGDCKYCGEKDVVLTPVVDFKWPGGPEPVWD